MSEFSTVIMSHDGQILEQLLIELGIKKGILAEKLHKSPNTITSWIKQSTLSSDTLIQIGKALRFDLTHKFPKLKNIPEASELNYFNQDPSELLTLVEEMRVEYKTAEKATADYKQEIQFLREQIEQLRELIEAKNQIITMKDEVIRQLKSQHNIED